MKKLFLIIVLMSTVMSAIAQVDDVTLVVSGEGVTKDEATNKALRSAIEQAFGVFVSANTEILNDELVKDEIATVSSGNIKAYTELGAITKANGNTEITLQATVSVKKLTSYAQSHGSSAEFAGAVFAANLKMTQLNRDNTRKAFANLVKQIKAVGTDDLYDCQIEVGNPQANGVVDVTLSYYATAKLAQLTDLIMSTLGALSLSKNERQNYDAQGEKYYIYNIPPMWAQDERIDIGNNIGTEINNVISKPGGYDSFAHSITAYSVAFLEPLPDINIRGKAFAIYDNKNNIYPLELGRREVVINNYVKEITGPHNNDDFSNCDLYIRYGNGITSTSVIRIPKSYKGDWRREKKGKERIKVFKPTLVRKISGKINVPPARFNEISGFTVKQQKATK